MNQYVISLNCRIDAQTSEEAKTKALERIEVREAAPVVTMPIHVYERLKAYRNRQKEHFIVLMLSTQNEIVRQEVVSVGTLNSSLVHPREVFRSAILAGCSHVILSHNHPSGFTEASQEDITVTNRLVKAGKLLGIELVDHVVIGREGYYSFKEHNLL